MAALPTVHSLTDCADLSKTVLAYLPQLYDVPQLAAQAWHHPELLKSIYLSTNPLVTSVVFSLALAAVVLVISEINRNYSQVDRIWSILPTVYNAHYVAYAHLSGLPTKRLDHVLALSCLWSLRLTFNYWRKGGYSIGSEDYRWEILREKIPPVLFFVFNVLFISLAQIILLFMVTTPTYVLLLASKISPLTTSDRVIAMTLLCVIVVEWFADHQQWDYQTAKKNYQKTAKVPKDYRQEDLDRGFIASGLWAYSRHPNFAAEQAVWVVMYLWSCVATNVYANWTAIGNVSYLVLFQSSTWFTELISAKKYTEYKEYQRHVGKFLPKLFGPRNIFEDKSELKKTK